MKEEESINNILRVIKVIVLILIFVTLYLNSPVVYAIDYIQTHKNSDKMANIYVDAYEICLNGISVGYISNNKESEKILKIIEKGLLEQLEIKREEINSIKIDTNIEYKNKSVEVNSINTCEEIVENIKFLNDNIDCSLFTSYIKSTNKLVVDIEPPINVISDGNLYSWQSRIEEGLQGKKEIFKIDKFINGNLENSHVIEENILIHPKETIIYKGIKNPIVCETAFLSYPTRGGSITSDFGKRKRGNHKGIDIGIELGSPINAACDGVVIYAGWDNIYGNMVILEHGNDIKTVYGHASELLTEIGKKVQRGEVIAKVGNTGRSTGPHLHFELRYNGNAINPNEFIE